MQQAITISVIFILSSIILGTSRLYEPMGGC
jgi:hypothetical protein